MTMLDFRSDQFSVDFKFDRVNVMLGANGSGKSILLRDIKSYVGEGNVVFVEGGRAISLKNYIGRPPQHDDRIRTATQFIDFYEAKRHGPLTHRLDDALWALHEKDTCAQVRHSQSVRSGSNAQAPSLKFDRLSLLFERLTGVSVRLDSSNFELTTHKNGARYTPSEMSDGERQILALLADLLQIEHQRVVLVDEPELNLHPLLTEKLWDEIETEFPKVVFIYATHSVPFMLRPSVQKRFVLAGAKASEIDSLRDLSRSDAADLLGSLPGFLSSNKVLAVEGTPSSVDAKFYDWLLKNKGISICPVESCSNILPNLNKAQVLKSIATPVAILGCVDRDFISDENRERLSKRSILTTDLHEIESYLCSPDIFCAVASRIARDEVSREEVDDVILGRLRDTRYEVLAQRFGALTDSKVGLDCSGVGGLRDNTALIVHLQRSAEFQLDRMRSKWSNESIDNYLEAENAAIDDALTNTDVAAALRLLPGKQLLNVLANRFQLSAPQLLDALIAYFEPNKFDCTHLLRQRILEAFVDSTLSPSAHPVGSSSLGASESQDVGAGG